MQKNRVVVAVVGGGRHLVVDPETVSVFFFPSSRAGGSARFRSCLRAIRGGAVRLVLVLVRWLGHSDFHALVRACKSAEVRFIVVPGGVGATERLIHSLVNGGVPDGR